MTSHANTDIYNSPEMVLPYSDESDTTRQLLMLPGISTNVDDI